MTFVFLGVTSILPEELDFPSTMTDMTHDTWMLRLVEWLWIRNVLFCRPMFIIPYGQCIDLCSSYLMVSAQVSFSWFGNKIVDCITLWRICKCLFHQVTYLTFWSFSPNLAQLHIGASSTNPTDMNMYHWLYSSIH